MKLSKITIVVILFLLPSLLSAQSKRESHFNKIKAKKVAHITEKLSLTVKEAQVFWPVYNEMEGKRDKLFKESKMEIQKLKSSPDMTEQDKIAIIDKAIENEIKRAQLKKEYHEKFKKILSAEQIVALYRAERSFKEDLLREMKKRQQKTGGNKKSGRY